METTLSAVCSPFPLPHVSTKYCSKTANPDLRSGGAVQSPYNIIFMASLQDPLIVSSRLSN